MNWVERAFDPHDSTIELHDLCGIGLIAAHVAAAVHSAWHGVAINFQEFGTGGAALVSALGAAGWMKGKQRAVDPTIGGSEGDKK